MRKAARITIDCSGIKDDTGLLNLFVAPLKFPDYYGENWNAWWDCMTDLAWLEDGDITVVLENIESAKANTTKDDFDHFITRLKEVCDYWGEYPGNKELDIEPRKFTAVLKYGDYTEQYP